MTSSAPVAHPFYIVEPHPRWVKPGEIDLTEIASRVYGKPFDVLRSVQFYKDNIHNDQVCTVMLSDDNEYEEVLSIADEKSVYLGYNIQTQESHIHDGHTTIEYWLSVGWVGLNGLTEEDVTVQHNPPDWMDCYGAVFPGGESFAQRHASPPIDHVLADLIRRGEIPRGDFLVKHWW